MIKKNKGLTIIEMIVYIAIFTMVMGAATGLVVYFYRTNSYIIQQSYAVESARKGIEIVTREIREATYSDTGAYPVVDAQAQSFSFYSDVDKDDNIEKVRYFLDGTNFKRGEMKATGKPLVYEPANEVIKIISDNVRTGASDVFTYYDASSTEITLPATITDIKLVKTDLVINIDPNRAPGEFTLSSSSQLRNLYEY